MVPVIVTHRGAGLVVGGEIRQLVIGAEGLALVERADAAGDVQLFPGDVVPNPVDGIHIGNIAGEGGDVGHSGIHIGSAHRVPNSFGLVNYLDVGLVVSAPTSLSAVRPAHVEHELGQAYITVVAGDAVEL